MMKTPTIRRHGRALFLSLLFALSALLLSACGGNAESPYSPEIPEAFASFYVYDAAGVMEPADEAYMISRNEALFALTGAQIVTVCVPDTGSLDIADYARQLFNKCFCSPPMRMITGCFPGKVSGTLSPIPT